MRRNTLFFNIRPTVSSKIFKKTKFELNFVLTLVPLLQRVLLSLGDGAGHSDDKPLQTELKLQSDSLLHWTSSASGKNVQCSLEQHGPWLGLHKQKKFINWFWNNLNLL